MRRISHLYNSAVFIIHLINLPNGSQETWGGSALQCLLWPNEKKIVQLTLINGNDFIDLASMYFYISKFHHQAQLGNALEKQSKTILIIIHGCTNQENK